MADIVPAKAGALLSEKVRKVWAKRTRLYETDPERAMAEAPTVVAEKSDGTRGAWFCMECGEVHRNGFDAHWHAEKHPLHAWISLDADRLEEP